MKFFLCASTSLWLIFCRAEMVQTSRRDLPVAGLRRRGNGTVEGFARLRHGGHNVDSVSRRRGVLVCHFLSAAQADVDLRFRP